MTYISRHIASLALAAFAVIAGAAPAAAQERTTDDTGSSSSTVTRRRQTDRTATPETPGVTARMQSRMQQQPVSDADMQWMRVIYRQLDLTKDPNTPLYFPEEPVDGQESLFRIIMRLLADGQIPAYEYLDGREVFTDQYKVKVKDLLDRYHIYYTDAKGSTEKRPRFTIDESDVPANEVLSYYIIERWEFDRRHNRMTSRIEAICPVLHRVGDFGGEPIRYPMFWLRFDDLRPHMATQPIFVSDDNNLATCTYDDYFNLGLYDGEIYKTRNLRNRSMAQLYPDPDDLKRAQDSIQATLDNFDRKLWVPSLDELATARETREMNSAATDSTSVAAVTSTDDTPRRSGVRSTRSRSNGQAGTSKPARVKKQSRPKAASSSSSSPARSVRNRKR